MFWLESYTRARTYWRMFYDITTSIRMWNWYYHSSYWCWRTKEEKKNSYTDSGTLIVSYVKVKEEYNFLDYIWGGCEISLVVAVDFTSSNGNPKDSKSLHYNDGVSDNEYSKAIRAVGEILAYYDTDQLVPVYGFGALLKNTREVSHCFPLNEDNQNAEVYGVDGILDIYRKALNNNNIRFYGPTMFSQIINAAAEIAKLHTTQQTQKYFILLIVTDGVINDLEAAKEAIVKASDLPLSIVVVGVGNANFLNMEILDSDNGVLVDRRGKSSIRNILQFVPFRDFRDKHYSKLAKETLAEIPDQLLSYMQLKEFVPNPSMKKSSSDLHELLPK